MADNWPVKQCKNCGREIRLVKTKNGWKAFSITEFRPHVCSEDALDQPNLRRIFNPKSDPHKK